MGSNDDSGTRDSRSFPTESKDSGEFEPRCQFRAGSSPKGRSRHSRHRASSSSEETEDLAHISEISKGSPSWFTRMTNFVRLSRGYPASNPLVVLPEAGTQPNSAGTFASAISFVFNRLMPSWWSARETKSDFGGDADVRTGREQIGPTVAHSRHPGKRGQRAKFTDPNIPSANEFSHSSRGVEFDTALNAKALRGGPYVSSAKSGPKRNRLAPDPCIARMSDKLGSPSEFSPRSPGAGKSLSGRPYSLSPRSPGGAGESDDEEEKIAFRISKEVKLILQRGDITSWKVNGENDAIVNAANTGMLGGGGVDGAIHRRAGKKLVEACSRFPQVEPGVRCPVGEARMTSGFLLPAKWVIHTVGPIYDSESKGNAKFLSLAYRKSLEAAVIVGAQYVAFPAISCGIYGYPMDEAAAVSLQTILEAPKGLSEVHFVLFNAEAYSAWLKEAERLFTRI